MAFNRDTYRMNQHRRDAWKALQKARYAKTSGQPVEAVRVWVACARTGMHCYLSYRRIKEAERKA